jgi:hypothetical protein
MILTSMIFKYERIQRREIIVKCTHRWATRSKIIRAALLSRATKKCICTDYVARWAAHCLGIRGRLIGKDLPHEI